MNLRQPTRPAPPALLLCLALAGLLASPAGAHALLLRSLPAANAELLQPPASLELWFSEALEPGFSQARLLASSGEPIPAGAVIIDPSDPSHLTLPLGQIGPGLYTVAWQSLSQADGHEYYGSFPFTVLNPDGSRPGGASALLPPGGRQELPSALETIARWIWLLGCLLLCGVPLFCLVVLPSGRAPGAQHLEASEARGRDLGLVCIWFAVLAVLLGHGLALAGLAARLGGLGQLPGLLLETRTGALALARCGLALAVLLLALRLPQPAPLAGRERSARRVGVILAALCVALLVLAAVRGELLPAAPASLIVVLGVAWALWASPKAPRAEERRVWGLMVCLAGLLALGVSFGSHAAAGAGSLWAVLGDWIHLLAAGGWAGGLALLVGWLWQVRRSPEALRSAGGRPAAILRRFSSLAGFSVFLLALSGVFNSLVELPALSHLWQTAYGQVLLLKLGLAALVLGLAFLNRRLALAVMHLPGLSDPLARLTRQVALEALLLLGLLLSVAVLVQTPPPRAAARVAQTGAPALPFNTIASAHDLYLHLQVSPNQVGVNHFWLHLYHADGSPIGQVQLVRLRFDYRQQLLGPSNLDLTPLGQDTFAAEGANLSQPGPWALSVTIRRRDLDDALMVVSLEVPAPAPALAETGPWANPVPSLPGRLLAVWAVVALGFVPLIWRRPLADAWPGSATFLRIGALLVILPGSILGIVWLARFIAASLSAPPPANPIPASSASIQRGQALYQERCLPCHGPAGLGDGPAALALVPRPANLQVHMLPGVHTDQQIFAWISDGYPNSAMPAFGELLSEEERWHVLNYIRTLVPGAGP